jgi:hypothetical protein
MVLQIPALLSRYERDDEGSRTLHSHTTAERVIEVIEAIRVMMKGQVKWLEDRDTVGQAKFVASLFGVVVSIMHPKHFRA